MSKSEIIRQLQDQNEQLRFENESLKAKISEQEPASPPPGSGSRKA